MRRRNQLISGPTASRQSQPGGGPAGIPQATVAALHAAPQLLEITMRPDSLARDRGAAGTFDRHAIPSLLWMAREWAVVRKPNEEATRDVAPHAGE